MKPAKMSHSNMRLLALNGPRFWRLLKFLNRMNRLKRGLGNAKGRPLLP